MPKLSLWNPRKGNDYNFADRVAGENIQIGGVGVLIHKYVGPKGGDDISDIGDVLFLENRGRNYDSDVYESRCTYVPQDVDYDLSQFGIFLSSDMLRLDFHYNDMIDMIGRKLVSGDVLEFPNMRDTTLSGATINKYYFVQDSLYASAGFGPTWYPHLWKVRAKQMTASEEFRDIIDKAAEEDTLGGEGGYTGLLPAGWADVIHNDPDGSTEPGPGCNQQVKNALDLYCKYIDITDEIELEALSEVKFDPKFFNTAHMYVTMDENNYPALEYWASGDGIPPNGAPLLGIGTEFPVEMKDGEYFLRTDYQPDRLFQKQGSCYFRVEDNILRVWTGTNKRLDTYLDNVNISTLEDGTQVREKQSLSSIIPDQEGLLDNTLDQILADEAERRKLAKKLDGAD